MGTHIVGALCIRTCSARDTFARTSVVAISASAPSSSFRRRLQVAFLPLDGDTATFGTDPAPWQWRLRPTTTSLLQPTSSIHAERLRFPRTFPGLLLVTSSGPDEGEEGEEEGEEEGGEGEEEPESSPSVAASDEVEEDFFARRGRSFREWRWRQDATWNTAKAREIER